MEALKPDEIGKFNKLVANLTDAIYHMRITTKRMEIKSVNINIVNFDNFQPGGWRADVVSISEPNDDGTLTSFKATIEDGKQINICSELIGGKSNETLGN